MLWIVCNSRVYVKLESGCLLCFQAGRIEGRVSDRNLSSSAFFLEAPFDISIGNR